MEDISKMLLLVMMTGNCRLTDIPLQLVRAGSASQERKGDKINKQSTLKTKYRMQTTKDRPVV